MLGSTLNIFVRPSSRCWMRSRLTMRSLRERKSSSLSFQEPDKMIEIFPVVGIPDVSKGDNLGRLIVETFRASGNDVRKGDIVVVAQKVVSKAEGRIVSLPKVKPSKFALEI